MEKAKPNPPISTRIPPRLDSCDGKLSDEFTTIPIKSKIRKPIGKLLLPRFLTF